MKKLQLIKTIMLIVLLATSYTSADEDTSCYEYEGMGYGRNRHVRKKWVEDKAFGYWEVDALHEGEVSVEAENECKLIGLPEKSLITLSDRDEPVLVVHFEEDRTPVISFDPGFDLKPGESVFIRVNSRDEALDTSVIQAFTYNKEQDMEIMAKILKSDGFIIETRASDGRFISRDYFDVDTLVDAYNYAWNACLYESND